MNSRFIEFGSVSNGGKISPRNFGYHIIPIYETSVDSLKHNNNIKWIAESLTDSWTWFVFGGHPQPGITYCFKSKIDAGMFFLCKCSSSDGLSNL